MEVKDAIFRRRSIRSFIDKPVESTVLHEIMLAGIYAPSAGNLQLWEFYCYHNPHSIELIRSVSPGILSNPKAVILLCLNEAKMEALKLKEWHLNCIMDIAMACQNMMLRAFELGLGTCPVSSFDSDSLRAILQLPDGIKPVLLVTVGHYKELPPPPPRNEAVIHIEADEIEQNEEVDLHRQTVQSLMELLVFLVTSAKISSVEPSNYGMIRLMEAALKVCDYLIRIKHNNFHMLEVYRNDLEKAVTLCFHNEPEFMIYLERFLNQYIHTYARQESHD